MKNKKLSLFKGTEFSLVIIILLIFAVCTIGSPTFLTAYNMSNVFKQSAITGLVSIAATFVIISGGMDLSLGSVCGLGSVVVAMMMSRLNAPIWLCVLAAAASGALCGLYNAFIIYTVKVAPFIATLGSSIIIRGIVKLICNAKTITGVYAEYANFSSATLFGVKNGFPLLALVWLLFGLVCWFVLRYTHFGRNIYTIGSNPEVAHTSGIDVRKNTYSVYIIAGLLCGIAGAMYTSRINSAVPTGGSGYEMDGITAAVLGGCSLSGGSGSMLGTMLGTYLITLISNGGVQLGINSFVMEIVKGVVLTIAVAMDILRTVRSNRAALHKTSAKKKEKEKTAQS